MLRTGPQVWRSQATSAARGKNGCDARGSGRVRACSGCGRGSGCRRLVWRWSALWAGTPAASGSLYGGPTPRPGPNILYRPLAAAPQLENSGIWRASPILVSGSSAYRDGEFLYQDFLYDDHGARGRSRDPERPPHRGRHLLAPQRHLHLPDRPGLRQQRRRPRRAPGQAARQRHRLPDHPEHAQGPLLDRDHDRNRQLSSAPRLPPRSQRDRAGRALPHRARRQRPTWCAPATRRGSHRRPRCRSTSGGARSRCSSPTAPGTPAAQGALGRRRGAMEQGGRPVPRARDRRHRHPARGRRRALRPHRLLQRRLPLPRAVAAHVPRRHRVQQPGLVARPPAGRRRWPPTTWLPSTPRSTSPSSRPGSPTTCAGSPRARR